MLIIAELSLYIVYYLEQDLNPKRTDLGPVEKGWIHNIAWNQVKHQSKKVRKQGDLKIQSRTLFSDFYCYGPSFTDYDNHIIIIRDKV